MTLRVTTFSAVVTVVLAAALGTFGYWRSHQQPRFPYLAQPLSDADYSAMAAKPGWRAQRLTVAGGVVLRGLRRDPVTPGGPWILFFAGNDQRLLSQSQQILDGLCAEHGWGGSVWAYRGFDSSGGIPEPTALTADGLAEYSKLLTEEKILPDAVHVVGFSLGTSIAAAVAAQAAAQPPATLTLLAPMTVLYMGQRTQLRLDRYETSKWLERIASPTLVVHGTRDTVLKVENGRTVAQALGARARLLEMPELGHLELPMSPAAQAAVRAFIAQHTVANTVKSGLMSAGS